MGGKSEALAIPQGFRANGVKSGIKPSGGLDLAVVFADGPCSAAGTFTTNRIAAAPVQWDRAILPATDIRAIVVNAGNANAATGELGLANARRTAELAAQHLGCRADQVLIASTGVIGRQLPMDRLEAGLGPALEGATTDPDGFRLASEAILTTDTRPKMLSKTWEEGGRRSTLLGFAKGAAMIGPRMATMLGFLITDAAVAAEDLRRILSSAVEDSFNCISVEGHTSTNDTVLILARGQDGEALLSGPALDRFGDEVRQACVALARMIPEDGEGATHLITIDVNGARDRDEARTIARAVADSPLVKTAITGADPNWGRIVSAAGYSGIPFEERELSLWVNEIPLYRLGTPLDFDVAAASDSIRSHKETRIRLEFCRGESSIRFWTCDLTAEYVRLNADYTT